MRINQTWINDGQAQQAQEIGGDRRMSKRYGMELQLRWKLIRRRRTIESGTGTTIDLSSGGILFDAGADLPAGLSVELSIAWPVLLHDVAPMQLFVAGRIVRSGAGWAALRTAAHEFRTMGVPMEQRRPLANAKTPPMRIDTSSSFGRSAVR
jgi:hypothetical protein